LRTAGDLDVEGAGEVGEPGGLDGSAVAGAGFIPDRFGLQQDPLGLAAVVGGQVRDDGAAGGGAGVASGSEIVAGGEGGLGLGGVAEIDGGCAGQGPPRFVGDGAGSVGVAPAQRPGVLARGVGGVVGKREAVGGLLEGVEHLPSARAGAEVGRVAGGEALAGNRLPGLGSIGAVFEADLVDEPGRVGEAGGRRIEVGAGRQLAGVGGARHDAGAGDRGDAERRAQPAGVGVGGLEAAAGEPIRA
jgi:hypothetical protein